MNRNKDAQDWETPHRTSCSGCLFFGSSIVWQLLGGPEWRPATRGQWGFTLWTVSHITFWYLPMILWFLEGHIRYLFLTKTTTLTVVILSSTLLHILISDSSWHTDKWPHLTSPTVCLTGRLRPCEGIQAGSAEVNWLSHASGSSCYWKCSLSGDRNLVSWSMKSW